MLLNHRADPNIENGEALVCACRNVDLESVALLLDAGATPTLRGKWGTVSPIEAICEADWFGNAEAPVLWRDRLLGKTPAEKKQLRKQYETNIVSILQRLKALGVEIDERNEFGQTPAEIATINGNHQAFQFLLNAGATSATVLHGRSVSGDHIDVTMMREAVILGKNETYYGVLMDIDARLFGTRPPIRFYDVVKVKAYQLSTAENGPRPTRGDIIYTTQLGEQEVSAAFTVKTIYKASRLPPYKDYLLLEERPDFNHETANKLLASFLDDAELEKTR